MKRFIKGFCTHNTRCFLLFSGLKVRFKTPALFPKKTVPNKDLISIPKESWGAEKPESDLDSSRLDGSESDSRLKQAEDDLELKGSESGNYSYEMFCCPFRRRVLVHGIAHQ